MLFSCEKEKEEAAIDETIVLSSAITTYTSNQFEESYILTTPLGSKDTYLLNKQGFPVKKWTSDNQAHMSYLDSNGGLWRNLTATGTSNVIGGAGGGIEYFNPSGIKEWEWYDNTLQYLIHHDLIVLPNGNVIVSAYEKHSISDAISNGRDSNLLPSGELVSDVLLEISRGPHNTATIVWKWDAWNHLVQDFDATKSNYGQIYQNPSRIDLNYDHGDSNLFHINSLAYIPEHDQIVMSSRSFDELWIIDHSTSESESAASTGGRQNKGGDLLYRWGNPVAFKAGTVNNRMLFKQHDITYIKNLPNNGANFMIFNNQITNDESAAVEINIPVSTSGSYNLLPNTISEPQVYNWTFQDASIYSGRRSGTQRLKNGNTLITSFSGKTISEVTNTGALVWKYEIDLETTFFTGASPFKARAYNADYSGLINFNLSPLDPSEY